MIKIILADDHVVVRQGLRSLIDQQEDMVVVGEADDGLQLLDSVDELHPDVVLVDLKMPKLNGIDAAGEIQKRHPSTHTIILTMHADPAYIERAIQMGVTGYVLKEENIGEMVTAIRHAAKGDTYLSSEVSRLLQGPISRRKISSGQVLGLTLRERQVFQLVVEGKTNNEIAGLLTISVRTVEGHRAHMMSKLNLKTHVDLVRYALKNGIFKD